MPSVEVSRESLYELVWTEPMTAVAKRFNVSDVAIIKACKKLNVPRLPRGYWARKQHTYQVPDPPALSAPTGDAQTHVFSEPVHGRPVWSKSLAEPIAFPSSARTHAKLLALKTKVTEGRPDRYGRIGDEKNINVPKKALPRAVRILSALFATLETRGGSVTVEDDRLTVSIRGERMNITAYEVAMRVKIVELIPYRVAEGNVYGQERYSTEVSTYTERVLDDFALGAADEEWIDSRRWPTPWEHLKTVGPWALGGVVAIWVVAAIIGWIVRGFVGIPAGMDHRPTPRVNEPR